MLHKIFDEASRLNRLMNIDESSSPTILFIADFIEQQQARIERLERHLFNISYTATRMNRASNLKRYLIIDLKQIENECQESIKPPEGEL